MNYHTPSTKNSSRWFHTRETEAKSILTKTSGFIETAGFTHSLTPARNCTYGCTYCYVPTLGVYGGLRKEDWKRWGQFTTIKSNVVNLLQSEIRPEQVIYCSPLVDPYQPSEEATPMMPEIIEALIAKPPAVFVIQTRGPLILRDLKWLAELSDRTILRVSFSLTTDREEVRRLYEPHCEPFQKRLTTIHTLREAGISVYATLAPLLPCDPENLALRAVEVTERDIIGDPLHVRSVKPYGGTTREVARRISSLHGYTEWHSPSFQCTVVERIRKVVCAAGRRFSTGPEAFAWLSEC